MHSIYVSLLCLRGIHTGTITFGIATEHTCTLQVLQSAGQEHLEITLLENSLAEVKSFCSCESCVLGCSLGKTLQLVMITFHV